MAARADAREQIRSLLASYGFNLGGMNEIVNRYISEVQTQNITPSNFISAYLPATQAYQERFSGNVARRNAGLNDLSPSEYLATEDNYKSILNSYNIPKGFYDSSADLAGFIGGNISPSELASRAQAASSWVGSNLDPNEKAAMKTLYGLTDGDFIAYVLDPTQGGEMLMQKARAVDAASSALNANINIGRGFAEELAGNTAQNALISSQNADQVFTQTAATRDEVNALAAVDGVAGLSDKSLVNSTLKRDNAADKQIAGLRSRERARYSGDVGSNLGATGINLSGSY